MSTGWPERVLEKPGVLEWMAWRRYLIATRASSPTAYPIIEEAAWGRLQEDLARVGLPLADRAFVAAEAAARTPADPRG
jgi:hypothetical protein